ncbi:MAG TPA: tail fiber domain-containing protein [Vicinamibacteria bacterium]|nr:tail fiber domain-containing protein [Vicinamibacteria bacterium]
MKNKLFSYGALAVLVVIVGFATAVAQTGVLFVTDNKVGIGTSTPQAPLHIQQQVGEPNIRLETVDNAGVRFEMQNANGEWEFIAGPQGAFNFNRVGHAGNEFVFSTIGNLVIQGTLTQGSSRTIKKDFEKVSGQDVLAKVVDLPLSSWSYKEENARHVGPMAEEFYSAFGLGMNEKQLAPGDVAGVALAAIQGLNETLQEKESRIASLEQQVKDLKALIANLPKVDNQ